ncbi:MAG: DUF370 domain-containing protein [Lachnospiraceae bacterium]|nr:DUF370 domain-containing protein [Lachnospiraceae bacterium]
MSKLINIGFGNMVNSEKILAIINPDSAPAKRIVQKSKEKETIIDATQGRRTKSIIITDTNSIILSALLSDTIAGRIEES